MLRGNPILRFDRLPAWLPWITNRNIWWYRPFACVSVRLCERVRVCIYENKRQGAARRDLYDREKVSDVVEQRRISFRSRTTSLSIHSDIAGINISFRMSRVSRFEVSADFWERSKGKISSGKLVAENYREPCGRFPQHWRATLTDGERIVPLFVENVNETDNDCR